MHPMLNIAIRAVRKAGDHVIKSLEKPQSIEVANKGNDVVTNVDHEAEAIIIETILKAYPDHCIVAAESGNKEGRDKECQWIIDPVDGTMNFVRGYPHFAVSVALRMRGRTEVAAVYDPVRNELFTATRGAGAQRGPRVGSWRAERGALRRGVGARRGSARARRRTGGAGTSERASR